MKYKVLFDGKLCICTREQIENGDYDIVSSVIAKTAILTVFNDLIYFRANDMQNYRGPRLTHEIIWQGFQIYIECIPEEELEEG